MFVKLDFFSVKIFIIHRYKNAFDLVLKTFYINYSFVPMLTMFQRLAADMLFVTDWRLLLRQPQKHARLQPRPHQREDRVPQKVSIC